MKKRTLKHNPPPPPHLLGEADDSEAVLDLVELLLVQFAGHDVVHHLAVLTVNVSAGTERSAG